MVVRESHKHLRGDKSRPAKGGVDPKPTECGTTRGQQYVGQDDNNSRQQDKVECGSRQSVKEARPEESQ